MKKSTVRLFIVLFLLTVILLLAPGEARSLKLLSLDFFQQFFQSEYARAAFDLDKEEAIAVFGWEEEEVFV